MTSLLHPGSHTPEHPCSPAPVHPRPSAPRPPAPLHMLITGGAGFIGCNLAHALLQDGWQVRIFDNLSHRGARSATWPGCRSGIPAAWSSCAATCGTSPPFAKRCRTPA